MRIELTTEEARFIRNRILIELDWGTSVYSQEELNTMTSIAYKIEDLSENSEI